MTRSKAIDVKSVFGVVRVRDLLAACLSSSPVALRAG